MEVVSDIFFKMQESIRVKLVNAGATSMEKAVTIQEAYFDTQEQNWLNYIAGGMYAHVKKTRDNRYYTGNSGH